MISKSEVIVADALAGAGIEYVYELPLLGSDGSRRYPDFTIEDAYTGETWFWEHLGMLGGVKYDQKWTANLAWYRSNGILPDEEGGGPNGTLLTTTETDGIDRPQISCHIKKIKSGVTIRCWRNQDEVDRRAYAAS
ncbi:hypothetical protein HFO81_22550 [Rhizobium leguminosarum]|uniref:hypothetical protein n=1 Tax=Rhizobium leguminosarum TaxID=384 RepID=UPI001C982C55|nr:hypothetical protein [Rhizobium leguminosarum]MBY5508318.1 hypothetical protein [Rhizobium leguminosarum]